MISNTNKTSNGLTQLTFGCSRLGKAAFEDTTEKAQSILDTVWALGIRSFDTASNYTYGDSEKILGDFIKGKEKDVAIITKGGTMLTQNASYLQFFRPFFSILRPILRRNKVVKRKSPKRKNFEIDYLLEMLDQSVSRMGENIFAYQLHNPTEVVLKDRSYADFFSEIKTKYNITKCGFALTSIEELDMCAYLDQIDIAQFPLNYYNFKPEYEQKLQILRDRGITLVGRTPFDRGLLTIKDEIMTGGKSGVIDTEAKEKKKLICEKYGISEIELALWFLKDLGLLDSILFSSFNLEHLAENVNAFNADIPDHFSWRNIVKDLKLEHFYLTLTKGLV